MIVYYVESKLTGKIWGEYYGRKEAQEAKKKLSLAFPADRFVITKD